MRVHLDVREHLETRFRNPEIHTTRPREKGYRDTLHQPQPLKKIPRNARTRDP